MKIYDLRKIKKIPFENVDKCFKAFRSKAVCSEWIENIFKNRKKITIKILKT